MRTQAELLERMKDYLEVRYVWHEWGYIAWQVSTGENIEIIFIEVGDKGKGHGQALLRELCDMEMPYHSVFAFRLASNEIAGRFYRKAGFIETRIPGLYRGGDAVLGVVNYEALCQNLSIGKRSGKSALRLR